MKSVYLHIPFCETICSYCDFCKFYYHPEWVANYLEHLKKEILKYYKNDPIYTFYIGGGTPSSLSVEELKKLFEIIQIFDMKNCKEFTFECNIENITEEKAKILKQCGVNRISIGIETFHKKYLNFLNRHHNLDEVTEKIRMLKRMGFSNINVDLIYALPGETKKEVEEDLNFFLGLDIPHISTYSLMIEPHTMLGIKKVEAISEDIDAAMYETIKTILKNHHFIHYETSNFCKKGFESKHNLVYWDNKEYYGFGIGASGYVNQIRYENTRNWNQYMKENFCKESHLLSLNEEIENEFILGFRKIEGISLQEFEKKYHKNLLDFMIIRNLLKEGKLIIENEKIRIAEDKIYISNQILCQLIGEQYE